MSSSSIPSAFCSSPDNHHRHHQVSSSDHLCYVHCNLCNTVLAVSVPSNCFFKTVTVRCGHCTNLLSVNMRGPLPGANHHHYLGHSLFSPHQDLLEIRSLSPSNLLKNPPYPNDQVMSDQGSNELIPKPPPRNRPPEKRKRVPSAYNRFIKDEIQRIKAGKPDISHREAFSAAAKNWAHFPHIDLGLMSENQPVKKANGCQQEGEDQVNSMRDGFLPAANMGFSPF